jgi:hypothetical protein
VWFSLSSANAAPPPDLSGAWRIEWVAANRVRVPILGSTTVLTRQVSLARVVPTPDGGWEQSHVACAIGAESDSSFTSTSFPAGFLAAMPPKRYPLRVTDEGDRWRVYADTGRLTIGFHPEPSVDAGAAAASIPSNAGHPSVFDWDEDGLPGATITVRAPLFGAVDVFVVQSSRGVLDGSLRVVDGVATAVEGSFRLEDYAQATIGASNPLFHTTPRATFLPEQSHLTMSRIGDDATCQDLVP